MRGEKMAIDFENEKSRNDLIDQLYDHYSVGKGVT